MSSPEEVKPITEIESPSLGWVGEITLWDVEFEISGMKFFEPAPCEAAEAGGDSNKPSKRDEETIGIIDPITKASYKPPDLIIGGETERGGCVFTEQPESKDASARAIDSGKTYSLMVKMDLGFYFE